MGDARIAVVAAGRPYPGEAVSGDAWTVQWHGDRCRVALIDGLGHGAPAATAAEEALAVLASHPALDPTAALQYCHGALRGTRGAAISIATLDLQAQQLTFAGVGNVEVLLWQGNRPQRPLVRRGIVGATLPTLRLDTLPLAGDWRLILHSDGVSARFDLDALLPVLRDAPQALPALLVERWGRATDDATAVVAFPGSLLTPNCCRGGLQPSD